MKKIIFLIFLLNGFILFSQKIEFGVSYSGGINFTGKDQTIIQLNEAQSYPAKSHLIRPHSIWNTHQIRFDVYPTQLKGFSASVGLRMFTFGWEIDTVSAGYASPTTPGQGVTFYARRESKLGYLFPTLGIAYEHCLYKNLKLKYTYSLGLFQIMDKEKQYSYAYSQSGEGVFEYIDRGLRDGVYSMSMETDIFDFQFGSDFVYSTNGLSIFIGGGIFCKKQIRKPFWFLS